MSILGLGTNLFVKKPRPGDSESTFSIFESSCHLLRPLELLKSFEAVPLSALPKDTTSELVDIFTRFFFYAEHQAGKL